MCSHMSTLHIHTEFYSWLTPFWHLVFSLINTAGRNAVMDPPGVELFTRTFSSLFAPPIQEGSENQTKLHVIILWTGVLIISDTLNLCQGSAKLGNKSLIHLTHIYVTPKWWLPCMVVIQSQIILVVMFLNTCGCSLWLCHLARTLLKYPLSIHIT